jgi:CheY-like chemotaxis protein
MLDFGGQRDLPTILLIDDDPISREVMATVLTMSGYTIYTAEGGASALQLLTDDDCIPDVILMDAQMPDLSGTQLIEQLRAHSHARLFAISGSNPPEDVIAAADGFLLKPFTPETLGKMLEKKPLSPSSGQSSVPTASSVSITSSGITSIPVVNPEILAQLREMMSEVAVRQIYDAIVTDLGRRIALLEAAIAKNDVNEIRRIGHAIKGGCGMAGAQQAARLGAALESPVNHLDNSPALLEKLRAAADRLERMLEEEFKA